MSLIALIVLLTLISYVRGISGTVVDAETGEAIKGAVIHVEWTITKGVPGLSYTKDYKTSEALTDSEGRFRIFGVLNPLVNPPIVVIYKRGYVAWRNDYIFPQYCKRAPLHLKNNNLFRLERFKKYSHSRHILFFSGDLSLTASSKLQKAYSWEDVLATREEELMRKKKTMKGSECTEDELWGQVIDELYPKKGENK